MTYVSQNIYITILCLQMTTDEKRNVEHKGLCEQFFNFFYYCHKCVYSEEYTELVT